MAKKKYKRKPESWFCIQYSGTNQAELVAEYAPHITYSTGGQGGPVTAPTPPQLLLDHTYVIVPTAWVLEDNYGTVSSMSDSQFQAFFEVQPGGP